MTLPADEALHAPIVTDNEVLARVDELIGKACRRQVWLLFVDDVDVQLPLVVPMADYPSNPYGGSAELLADRIGVIMEAAGAAQVIIVWERRLSAATTEADRTWARELGVACSDGRVSVRAQLISHRDGTRWFAPDDYL